MNFNDKKLLQKSILLTLIFNSVLSCVHKITLKNLFKLKIENKSSVFQNSILNFYKYKFFNFCFIYYLYNLIVFSENFSIIYYYLLPKIKKKFVQIGIYLIVKKFQNDKLNFIFFGYTLKQCKNVIGNSEKNKFLMLKNLSVLVLKKKLKNYFLSKTFKSIFELIFKLNLFIKSLYFYLEFENSYKVLKLLDQYLFYLC